ncbi:nucleotide-diphosphate-sugar epimerase/NmrA family protein [Amycolatopsis mediterranei S699]|uniref:Nucleotide-diphosphate-sugar epimerase/NmrA family protein n=2 Tax=Amycolatopsis mediterranei TaxID=33910 RepID=A0A0H3DEB3_AMYMU|nr:NAD(P)H-binding protein [Amycolatopsis mediterranei]ADJ49046.1 nucleotide-diphosphate-sugar epimerase/NmrA family protein [Amycolatopsis mediterranei U32]AEK46004.1 nucleotide-diphosphate-sugar epimerase/NmrA family protein [Amycolatopsis mediterranei S699]AFO80754.1 nucleotide-diphosphate-sugar epimerase/NmrA family protein [Amycolatopsis mediterranei S699]AGT87882.1 nucleotide-diphosphate-sugar epimerase/NmrA family protein [Amycolatopsis mediterranei RB]KDO04025.1 nucleoside-diphosphate 
MILVTGATGTVGREVVRQLVEAGRPVRALTRDPAAAAAVLGDGVEFVAGDLGRPETLPAAVAGADSVFLLSGGGPETPLHDANLGQAAAEAGVGHVVKLSIIGAEYEFTDLVSTWHLAGERALRQIGARPGGPAWTFLRPGEFTSNARLWAGPVKAKGTVFWSQVDTPVAVVDPRDVAAVAVTTLLEPGHQGQTYRFGGPEPLTVRERVAKLGAALGRELTVVDVPIAAARDAAAKSGRQPLVVETTLGNLTREEFQVHAVKVLPTFEKLVGRPPLTFDQWVADHIEIFR